MSTRPPRKPLYERLKAGLEEGISFAKGALTLRTIEVPEAPPEIDGETVAAIRQAAGMSQSVFAKLLNVSTKTLQSWEQGLRNPSDASRRLIQVFSEYPEALCQSAGMPIIALPGVKVKSAADGRKTIVVNEPARRMRKASLPKR